MFFSPKRLCVKRFNLKCFSVAAIIASLVALSLVLSSCGLKVGEKPPNDGPIAYSGKGYGCVGEVPERIRSYFADEMSETEINHFVQCLEHSLTSFAQLTRGSDRSTYSPDELRNFFLAYFLQKREISDSLLHEFMVIKVFLVGGTVEKISRSELYGSVEVLEDVRLEALRMKPHLRLLNPALLINESADNLGPRLNQAYEALRLSVQVLADRLKKANHSYEFAHLEKFIEEFRSFVQWKEHFKYSHPASDWVDLLKVFKEVTVSGEFPDRVQPEEWLPLLQSFSRWYMSYLQFEVGVKSHPLFQGVGLQNLMYLAQEVFGEVEESINRQPSRSLSFDVLDRLIQAVYKVGFFPTRWREESLRQALPVLVTRVFGDGQIAPDSRKADGLNLQSLSVMKSEFYRWAYVQLNLDAEFGASRPENNSTVPQLHAEGLLPPALHLSLKQAANSDWNDFDKIRQYVRPLYSKTGNRVFIVPTKDFSKYGLEYGLADLSRMNILRSAIGLIFRGFSNNPSSSYLWGSGISEADLQNFFDSFREMGIDVGLIDQRAHNTGIRTYIEGNLFTFDADGVRQGATGIAGQLNFVEAMELFASLVSGGDLSSSIRQGIAKNCESFVIDGVTKFRRQCVQINLAGVLIESIDHMPNLQSYLKGLSYYDQQMYAEALLETAFSPKYSNNSTVEPSEFSTLSVITQYSEMVMTRYDTDGDGILTSAELENAFPNFIGYIQKMADEKMHIPNMSEARARAVLLFIMEFKYIPDKDSYSDMFSVGYIQYKSEPTLALNRMDLSYVFLAIGQKLVTSGDNKSAPASP